MSKTNIPERIKIRLWGKAGGRCEYEGCNERLWLDELTKAEFNTAYIAHIVADSPDGPRGDSDFSEKLKENISNLMLMCDKHHRLIDRDDVDGHSVDRLQQMKAAHESRIDLVTDISPDKQSHILLYGANIGTQGAPLSYREAANGMLPNHWPASMQPIELSLKNSSFEDSSDFYWKVEERHLKDMVAQIRQRIKSGEISHLSIFSLAPQPLLILLGSLLSDIPAAEVYQRKKEPSSWTWEDQPSTWEYVIERPENTLSKTPALVFALSATVVDERITSILGTNAEIWKVTIPKPHNDFVRSRVQTYEFRRSIRRLLNEIKAKHGEHSTIHVFPAMPVSLAVDFGRIHNLKSDLPLIVYDENKSKGGFVKVITFGGSTS